MVTGPRHLPGAAAVKLLFPPSAADRRFLLSTATLTLGLATLSAPSPSLSMPCRATRRYRSPKAQTCGVSERARPEGG